MPLARAVVINSDRITFSMPSRNRRAIRPEKYSPRATVGNTACQGEVHNATGNQRHLMARPTTRSGATTNPGMQMHRMASRLPT